MTDFNLVNLKPEPFAYVSHAGTIAEMPKIMGEAFRTLEQALRKTGATPSGPPFAHYRSVRDGHVEVDVGFPMPPGAIEQVRQAGLEIGETPRGKAMHGVHVGPYDTLNQTYDALVAELRDQGLEPAEDMWERYLTGPETPPEQTRTEVFWPAQ